MARDRGKDEILDQAVYAVACVAYHYGPGFSAEGLHDIRNMLDTMDWWCDSNWCVDTWEDEGDPNPDFHPSVLREKIAGLNFKDVVRKSRTGEE